jgi:hypothetical protein
MVMLRCDALNRENPLRTEGVTVSVHGKVLLATSGWLQSQSKIRNSAAVGLQSLKEICSMLDYRADGRR